MNSYFKPARGWGCRQGKAPSGQAASHLQRDMIRTAAVSSWGMLDSARAVVQFSKAAVKSAEIALEGIRQGGVLVVNFIRLAQSRESGDAPSHGGNAKTYLVGGHWALQITSLS